MGRRSRFIFLGSFLEGPSSALVEPGPRVALHCRADCGAAADYANNILIANRIRGGDPAFMPRKPTAIACQARASIVEMVGAMDPLSPLPTLQVLGERFRLHPSTLFRMLRDLADEGLLWQSPSGRFHPYAGRKEGVRGAPICFIGREMWRWSRLYQEILEGAAEVCSSNGSPLVLLSARSLVRQGSSSEAPQFASARVQRNELAALIPAIPRGCAGCLFDHLWSGQVLSNGPLPGRARLQLLHGTGCGVEVAAPDYRRGILMAADFVRASGARRPALVVPFRGDPAIDRAVDDLREALRSAAPREVAFQEIGDDPAGLRKAIRRFDLLVCPEDNVALAVARTLEGHGRGPAIFGTQGTGVLHSPHARLRYDYRRFGRAAVSRLLLGTRVASMPPSLIAPEASPVP
jgi:hypothetical protein